jgi:cytochrome c-type biogenesis protein CcmH|tara:strand:- start:607 stop:969 length:363 start_codon:yes stop_codon:yes gene_type:complete
MKIKIIIFFTLLNLNIVNAQTIEVNENQIYKNIRCLICQGQSVADSNANFAQTIKLVVKDQIKQGKTEKEIYEFLIQKYGEWIVFRPPFNQNNFILWTLPYLVFLLGGLIIFFILKKKSK